LLLLGGCGLSDQQLTSLVQNVLATALNTVVTTLIQGAAGTA